MRVWTNGLLHVARAPEGLYLFRGSQLAHHFPLPAESPEEGGTILAVAPSGTHAWLSGLRRVSFDDGAVEASPREAVLDVVGLDDSRVAALLAGKTGQALRLAWGTPGEPWERVEELTPTREIPVSLPASLWARSGPPRASSAPLAGGDARARRVRLQASPHALTVVCDRSGLIGVFCGQGAPVWLRVAMPEGTTLAAVATERGVLITLTGDGEGGAAHVSLEGLCEGHTGPTAQSVSAVPLAGGRFALFDEASQGRLKVFELSTGRDMHPRARLTLPQRPRDAAASADGRWAVFAGDSSLSIFELGDKRLVQVASVVPSEVLREASAKAREKQRIEQGEQYKRSEGPPALGFPASKSPVAAWEAERGAGLELGLALRSTGGPGQGVSVELSGPALEQGLIEPVEVSLAGQHATPSRRNGGWAVELPAAEIPRGMAFPFDPKPRSPEQTEKAQALLAATHLDLRVRLSAVRAGAAMLTVAARSLNGSSAPMKWTRLVTVRDP